jgi:hypothetical protein
MTVPNPQINVRGNKRLVRGDVRVSNMRTAFKSWNDFESFRETVTRSHRFVHPASVDCFLAALFASCRKRRRLLKRGTRLWRSQLGTVPSDDGTTSVPFPPDRMIPCWPFHGEGRANPIGIPVLYLATEPNTAMAEMRPWKGAEISLAEFQLKRDLTVVDCASDNAMPDLYPYTHPRHRFTVKEREAYAWGDINRHFSTPISCDADRLQYIPTQILAESFRSHGYDGVVYKSSLGQNHSVVLFSLEDAIIVASCVVEVKNVRHKFHQTCNWRRHCMKEKSPNKQIQTIAAKRGSV